MASGSVNLTERYVASMILAGVGDAMGFRNGGWEFKFDGEAIHKECENLGGVQNLKIRRTTLFYLLSKYSLYTLISLSSVKSK